MSNSNDSFTNLLSQIRTLNRNLIINSNITNISLDALTDSVKNDYFILNNTDDLYTFKNVVIGDDIVLPSTQFQVVGNTNIQGSIIDIGNTSTGGIVNIGKIGSVVNINGTVNIADESFVPIFDKTIVLNQKELSPSLGTSRGGGVLIRDALVDDQGYFIVSNDGVKFQFKLPEYAGIVNLPVGNSNSTFMLTEYPQTVNGDKTFTGITNITNTTLSTTSTTGALIVAGGVGIGGDLNINGNLNVGGTLTFINSQNIDITDNIVMLNVKAPISNVDVGIGITRYQPENDIGDGDVVNDVATESGTCQSSNTINTVQLSLSASGVTNNYRYWYIKITNNSPSGVLNQVRKIVNYNGPTRVATINSNWTIVPDSTTTYNLYCRVYLGMYYNENGDEFVFGATPDVPGVVFNNCSMVNIHASNIISDGTTQSTSISTGAIKTLGGLGIAKDAFIGGSVNIANNLTISGTTDSISLSSGAFILQGGGAINKNLFIGGKVDCSSSGDFQDLNIGYNGAAIYGLKVNGKALIEHDVTINEDLKVLGTFDTANLSITGTTESTDPTTGALVLAGGLGVAKNTNIGGNLKITGTSTFVGDTTITSSTNSTLYTNGALIISGGVGIAKNININQNLAVSGTSTLTGITNITNTTQSSNITSGALIVSGGLGVAKNTYIGGNLNITGTSTLQDQLIISKTLNSTGSGTGSLTTTGGASFDLDVYIGSNLYTTGKITPTGIINSINTTQSSSTGTGAFVTLGGIGITKNAYIGQALNVGGQSTFQQAVSITDGSSSTSSVTGALVVTGGVGIGADLYVTGSINNSSNIISSGKLQITNSTNSVSTVTGSMTTLGGLGVALDAYFGNNMDIKKNLVVNGDFTVVGKTTITSQELLTNLNNIMILNGMPVISSRDGGIFIERYQISNDAGTGDIVNDANIYSTGFFQSSFSLTQSYLDVSASGVDDTYKNMWIKVTNNIPSGVYQQVRKITAYNGTTKLATFDSAWTTPPNASTTYAIYNNLYLGNYFDEANDEWKYATAMLQGSLNTVTINNYSNLRLAKLFTEDTTQSTTSGTGSIIIKGGVGIAKNLNVGGNLGITGTSTLTGDLKINSVTSSSSASTGSIVTSGGMGITENLYIGGILNVTSFTTLKNTVSITDTTNSISSTSGALTISGGLGVALNTYIGGFINIGTTCTVNSTTDSTTTTTGALIVSGGTGIAKNLNVGGNFKVTNTSTLTNDTSILSSTSSSSTSTGALVVSGGVGIAENLFIGGLINITSTATIAGITKITLTTQSTTTTTGALIVSGGVGIAKNVNVGGNLNISGSSTNSLSGITTFSDTTNSTLYTNGALIISGGLGIALDVNTNGLLNIGTSLVVGTTATINSTNDSSSTITGALVVSGGVGIAKNLYVGSDLNVTSTITGNGIIYAKDTSNSTNTSTGSLIVSGGIGIAKNVYIGQILNVAGDTTIASTTESSNTTSGSLIVSGGSGIAKKLFVGGDVKFSSALTVVGNQIISDATSSTNSTSGALVVTGGVGIGGSVNIGTNLTVINDTTSHNIIIKKLLAAQGSLYLYDDTDTYYTQIKSSTLMSASYTLVLPSDDGTSNQTLTTDGSGNLSWTGPYQSLDSTLTALAAYNTNGFLTQTAADTFVGRKLVSGSTNSLTITNNDGVSGNPTFTFAQDIHTSATPSFAGLTITGNTKLNGVTDIYGGIITLGAVTDSTAINIGSASSAARTINIGTSTSANIVNIGSSNSTVNITGGLSGINFTNTAGSTVFLTTGQPFIITGGSAAITLTSTFDLNTGSAAINIGTNGSETGSISIGTSTGARTIIFGNSTSTTSLELYSGTGNTKINSTGDVIIGDNVTASNIYLGTGNASKNIQLGYTITTTTKIELFAKYINLQSGVTGFNANSTGPMTINTSDTTNGIKIGTTTSGVPISIGNTVSETTVNDNLTVKGDLSILGSLSFSSIEINDNILSINNTAVSSKDVGFIAGRFQNSNDTNTGDVVNDTVVADTGTAQSGSTNTITLKAGSSSTDDYYKNWWIKITNDSPSGIIDQVRKITAYNGTSKIATVDSNWTTTTPDNTTTYSLYNKNYVGTVYDESTDKMILGYFVSDTSSSYDFIPDTLSLHAKNLLLTDDTTASLTAGYAIETKNDSNYKIRAYAFDTFSSKRYKENIKLLDDIEIVDKLNKINTVSYNWKQEFGDHGIGTHIGFIAEEINEIFPEIVSKDENNIPTGVDYSKLVPQLLQYVKYLHNEIIDLKKLLQK